MIDIHEFQAALALDSTEFTERVFAAFDKDGSAEIDFFEFIVGLSALSPKATIEEKAKFCFDVYDIDKNGSIDKNELKEVLTFSLCGNAAVKLDEKQLDRIIDATFRKMDVNNDGDISIEEFTAEAKKNPAILSCVNLNLEAILK
ncbi:EF hand family protein [Tritrichomonas foetus]|uniref:EF hand family protein n=1 Tax=Tritrichomonas foetus TaxID=1144522 RepID=A0A1J4JXR8_9EUKA|nr:EF hand family protein [Tritrichomonas foetus]|eukprot:OHT03945.1 EF hand family protein [Tritrichomonas foetus]